MSDTSHPSGMDKRRAARIDQVLNAAADCFVEFGFHGAGMAKIAKRASMSVGHIYHYFENKEAIIAAIVDRESELAAERFAEFEEVPRDELVHVMTERVDEMVDSKADAFQSVLNLEILAESQRNPQIACIMRQHDEEVRELFRSMLKDKLNLPDAEARTELLLSLFGGLASRIIRHPELDRHTLIPLIKQVMHLALEPCDKDDKRKSE
ncbi:TetR/AcrR family transcriptional regulator [Henriciella sp.]|uniref:TetR/AcrR family transcriptional regulator n=1 Tax=Henriciella sp. TaxID=1968823 RepID=UPI0026399D3E|nr:TetR/AcrR family transcriptional regulator [Henriciella sp.]